MTFLGVQVQQFRTFHVLQLSQDPHHLLDIMTVEGSEVTDVHTLEDVLLMTNRALHRIAQSDESLSAVILQHTLAMQPPRSLEADAVIRLVGIQVDEIFLHAAHRAVDRHVIVVQDDEQVVGGGRHVVQSFESQTARHGTIANHGHHLPHLPVGLFLLGSHGHTQGCRDAVRGMSAGKRVVFALLGGREGHDAVQLAVRAETLPAPCQYLMSISLMTHIPNNTVVGGVIYVMEGNGQLHHAKTGGEVSGVYRQLLHDVFT